MIRWTHRGWNDITTVKNIGEIAWKLIALALFVLIFMALMILPFVLIAISLYGNIDFNELLDKPLMQGAEMFVLPAAFIAAVLIMYVLFERGKGLALGWKQHGVVRAGVRGIWWGLVLITVAFLAIWLFRGVEIEALHFDGQVIQGMAYSFILFAWVAVSEELVTRGYIHGLVRRRFGREVAIVFTAVIFAILHILNASVLDSFVPLFNLFIVGLLLGLCREWSGGLWLPIGFHFSWNLFQGQVFGFRVSGMPQNSPIIELESKGHALISGGSFGAEGSVIVTGMLVIAVIILWQWYRGKSVYDLFRRQ